MVEASRAQHVPFKLTLSFTSYYIFNIQYLLWRSDFLQNSYFIFYIAQPSLYFYLFIHSDFVFITVQVGSTFLPDSIINNVISTPKQNNFMHLYE